MYNSSKGVDTMLKIKIKDIESLYQTKQQIINLQKEIDNLEEVKKFKKTKQTQLELEEKITSYSTYNSIQIGDILAKLMTAFEGIPYRCTKYDDVWILNDCCCSIEPISRDKNIGSIYPSYKIKKLAENHCCLGTKDETERCYLPPSTFQSNFESSYRFKRESNPYIPPYIPLFLDYLYERRSSKLLGEILEKELEEILREFLEITKPEQQQRKDTIEKKTEEIHQKQKRKEFEQSCFISRKLIYNSLSYIINNYEENMTAIKETEAEWTRSRNYSELYGYHKLVINFFNKEIIYRTITDHLGCYPDEEHNGWSVDTNQDTDICFFDLKNTLAPIIKNSIYVKKFMDMVEFLYDQTKIISADDIHQILVVISNENRAKQRKFRKKK